MGLLKHISLVAVMTWNFAAAEALRIDPAGVNVLSPGTAECSDGVRPEVLNFMLLWSTVSGKNAETLRWKLHAPAPGDYAVRALISTRGAMLKLSANGGPASLCKVGSPDWDRHEIATVRLAKGENLLELEIPAGQPTRISSLELIRPEAHARLMADAMAVRQTPDWFKDAGHGLMFQWTNRATPPEGDIKEWTRKVDDFNLGHLLRLVDESHASFVIWSVTWGQQYISAPVGALDAILAGRTTKRDLLGELAEALKARGVRLIFYYHYGYDCYHSKDPEWMEACGGYLPDKSKLYRNIATIVGELGDRYGEKLDGWFFDGGHRYYDAHFDGTPSVGVASAPFGELALAARKGNAKRVLCFNPWILPKLTEYQDYFAGEGKTKHDGLDDGIFAAGPQKGLMAFGCFTLERKWGHIEMNTRIARPKYSGEDLVGMVRQARAARAPIAINLEMYEDGSVGPDSADVLRHLGRNLPLPKPKQPR